MAPLGLAQQILGRPGAVRRIAVSALTKPEDALARRDPKSLGPAMYDRWYCSPYPQSIAYQLEEAIPHSHAEQIRQVAQTEGVVLSSITGLMLLITLAALLASALAVSAAMATAMFERGCEVGLMKALGAGSFSIAAVFFAEATLLALIGGTAGFAGGAWLADRIGALDFRVADCDPAGAFAGGAGDCGDRNLCRQRGRDPSGGEIGSGICACGVRL